MTSLRCADPGAPQPPTPHWLNVSSTDRRGQASALPPQSAHPPVAGVVATQGAEALQYGSGQGEERLVQRKHLKRLWHGSLPGAHSEATEHRAALPQPGWGDPVSGTPPCALRLHRNTEFMPICRPVTNKVRSLTSVSYIRDAAMPCSPPLPSTCRQHRGCRA